MHRKNSKNLPSFQVEIHLHPSHPQPNIINSSFSAQVGLFLTKLKLYCNDSIEANTIFRLFIVTLKIGDTVPLGGYDSKTS